MNINHESIKGNVNLKRLVYADISRSVKVGDTIPLIIENPSLRIPYVATITVDDSSIFYLIEKEIIDSAQLPMHFLCIYHLAKRIKWRPENLLKYLRNLYKISPRALEDILTKELALIIDEGYSDHIKDSEPLYAVDSNGIPIQVALKCYPGVIPYGVFRTQDQARWAYLVVKKGILQLVDSNE